MVDACSKESYSVIATSPDLQERYYPSTGLKELITRTAFMPCTIKIVPETSIKPPEAIYIPAE